MEKEQILSKMRQLRDLREKEIFNEQSNDTKSVENVQYLGKININEAEEDIFLMVEQNNGKTQYIFVNDRGERIGLYSERGILLFEREFSSIEQDEALKKELEKLQRPLGKEDKYRDLNECEKETISSVAKALGITDEEIEKMSEGDLNQELKDKTLEDEEEKKEVSKDEIKRVRVLQETETDVRVDEVQTLGQKLDIESANQKPEQKFIKFAVVYSDSLKSLDGENGENTGYAFVGIRQDGSAQRLDDILKMDPSFGNTNTETSLRHDQNGNTTLDNKTNSRYIIKGTNDTLAVKNGMHGEIEIYYGGTEQGTKRITETIIETTNIRPTSREVLETQSERKGIYSRNMQINEAKRHFARGEEKLDTKDADGNKNTQTHVHDTEVLKVQI